MIASNRDEVSAYRMLARELRTEILQNRYAGGKLLPTEAELAEQHGVSRQTVRRAFQDLVAEGMVVRRPGRGTFVAERDGQYLRQFGSVEDLMALSVDTQMEVLVPLHRGVDIEAASRLRLSGDVVHSLTFRRLHNAVPFCVTTVHLPASVADRLATLGELGEAGCVSSATVIGLLDARLEHPIAGADQSITVATASPGTAEHLGCEIGTPLLRVDRIYFDTTERLVELGISHFLPEHYSYRVRLRRSVS